VNAVLFDVALTAYILAAAAAIGSLAGRRDQLAWVALLLTQAGFICHTGAVILRGIELRRLPVSTLAEMISLLIWAVILLDFWVERQRRIRPLSAFVLPVVLALGLGLPTGLRSIVLEPPVRSGWIMVHVALVLVGLAALVLNFGGALMYLVVERQLKAKRPGTAYYRLPPLETLDRLTIATLTVSFPFLMVGLALGALSARGAWGSVVAFDPLALFSLVMWIIYAATLLGRVLGHWRGRRAAYLSIAGFCVMLVTLSAGAFLHGHHGS
jgi:cytochrome c-type biogenesis protein CcsB